MNRQIQTFLLLLALCAGGCLARRDDSTGTMRQIVAEHLKIPHEEVKAESTMGSLGFTESQFSEMIREIEERYSTRISVEDDLRHGSGDDSWKDIRVIDLADQVRPDWNTPDRKR